MSGGEPTTFIDRGLVHIEMYFDEDSNPSDEIFRQLAD